MTPSRFARFQELARQATSKLACPPLTPSQERLLNVVGGMWAAGPAPTVHELMRLSSVGSATTVHRLIHALKRLGYLEMVIREEDQRVKEVHLGPQAQRYFAALGQCLAQVAAEDAQGRQAASKVRRGRRRALA